VGPSIHAASRRSRDSPSGRRQLDDKTDDEITHVIVRLTAEEDGHASPEEIAARIRRIADAAERSRQLDREGSSLRLGGLRLARCGFAERTPSSLAASLNRHMPDQSGSYYRADESKCQLREALALYGQSDAPQQGSLLASLYSNYKSEQPVTPPLSPAAEQTLTEILAGQRRPNPPVVQQEPPRKLARRRSSAPTAKPTTVATDARLLVAQRQGLVVALKSASHMETMCALLEEMAARDREAAEREARAEARLEASEARENEALKLGRQNYKVTVGALIVAVLSLIAAILAVVAA
jgi:hypothetical protein